MRILTLDEAHEALKLGKIIIYPTEAVYGLGCDPFNKTAVEALLSLKSREQNQGLILLIADWTDLWPLVSPLDESLIQRLKATWPGHTTWIMPKSEKIPIWISGEHQSVAIRMTAHPIAHALCKLGPVVSTSANISKNTPIKNIESLLQAFPHGVHGVVSGALGEQEAPSAIYDLQSGIQLR